jgi:hypothetical protein
VYLYHLPRLLGIGEQYFIIVISVINILYVVGIGAGYGLDGRSSICRRSKRFSLLDVIQTGSGTHPASYPVGTGGSFPASKAAGA